MNTKESRTKDIIQRETACIECSRLKFNPHYLKINTLLHRKGIHYNLRNSSKEVLGMKLTILNALIREVISQVTNWKFYLTKVETEEIQNEVRRRKEKIRPFMNLIQNRKQRILIKLSPLWKDESNRKTMKSLPTNTRYKLPISKSEIEAIITNSLDVKKIREY